MTGDVTISFSTLVLLTPTSGSITTGVANTQSLWLTGYETAGVGGTVALQSVWVGYSGGTWQANATLFALDSSVTSATVKVFYAYSA